MFAGPHFKVFIKIRDKTGRLDIKNVYSWYTSFPG
jgi:hypothetical protein